MEGSEWKLRVDRRNAGFIQSQFREVELDAGFAIGDQIDDPEVVEVGDDDKAGLLTFLDAAGQAVVEGLLDGDVEVLVSAFVLHQKGAGPEEIHKAYIALRCFRLGLELADSLW